MNEQLLAIIAAQLGIPLETLKAALTSGSDQTGALAEAAAGEENTRWHSTFDSNEQARKKQLEYQYKALKQQGRNADADRLLRAEIERGNLEVSRGAQGLSALRTYADLASSPDNYFKLLDFSMGASQRQDVPLFFQSLLNNQPIGAWHSPGGAATPQSAANAVAAMSGGGAQGAQATQAAQAAGTVAQAPAYSGVSTANGGVSQAPAYGNSPGVGAVANAANGVPASSAGVAEGLGYSGQEASTLNAAGQIFNQGFGSLGAQALEQSPEGTALLLAAGKRLGNDPALALRAYRRSRFGNQLGQAGLA